VTGTVNPNNPSTLQSKTSYDAWGESKQTGATQSRHGYTGHLQDTETGLIYARARYYDPELRRFLSQDPIEGLLDSPVSCHAMSYRNLAIPIKFIYLNIIISETFIGTFLL